MKRSTSNPARGAVGRQLMLNAGLDQLAVRVKPIEEAITNSQVGASEPPVTPIPPHAVKKPFTQCLNHAPDFFAFASLISAFTCRRPASSAASTLI